MGGEGGAGKLRAVLSWTRREKEQLEEQLKERQTEANRLQEELTKEQKIGANLKTVLTQATSLLQDIVRVSKQWEIPRDHEGIMGLFLERLMASLLFSFWI